LQKLVGQSKDGAANGTHSTALRSLGRGVDGRYEIPGPTHSIDLDKGREPKQAQAR